MFQKVRKKFILVSVCSVFLVLFCILGTINVLNYTGVIRDADRVLSLLKEGDGIFEPRPGQDLSPEILYSTRYFTVTFSADGKAVDVDLNRIVSVTAEEALSYAETLYASDKTSGFCGAFRYGTLDLRSGGRMYLFVDCSIGLGNFYNFLASSLVIGLAGLAVVFLLIFLFSGRIMKPVAESYRKQKQFITDAGHEIKTPLTIIGADTEIIEMQTGPSEWTAGIKEQISRLASLTEKLVFLARLEEQPNIALFEFSLSDVVKESVQPFFAVAAAKGIALHTDIRDGILFTGNEEMLRRLVTLLTDNALKYTDGDAVFVSLRTEGNRRLLEVRNPASYLEEGDLDRFFERFARGDKSRNSGTDGHGIGLAVVRAIAEAHRGKIRGECKKGSAVFSVIL